MNIVVTGGGTVAPIDDVRRIVNVSTGRFSAEITEACLARGANVWHVHAPSAVLPFQRDAIVDLGARDFSDEIQRISALHESYLRVRDRIHLRPVVDGTVESYAKTLQDVFETVSVDLCFLAMAVSDFEPEPVPGKIDSQLSSLHLTLKPTPKVICSVRDWGPSVYLVGFKLLSDVSREQLIAAAASALAANRADLTVANDLQTVSPGKHTIHLVRSGGRVETLGPEGSIAEGLVDRVLAWSRVREDS